MHYNESDYLIPINIFQDKFSIITNVSDAISSCHSTLEMYLHLHKTVIEST